MKLCPGPFAGSTCPDNTETPKGFRCRWCAKEANRYKAMKWYQEHKGIRHAEHKSGRNMEWAQSVAPVMTIKTADKMISDAIKGAL